MEDLGGGGVKEDPCIVCPWHAFRFSLRTGGSEDVEDVGHFAKVLKVHLNDPTTLILTLEDSIPSITVSKVERFSINDKKKPLSNAVSETVELAFVQEEKEPRSLVEWCVKVLKTAEVGTGTPPDEPPRHEGVVMVAPGQMKRRGKGGTVESRIAILHSLANIEQWAIDLAFDVIARFAGTLVNDVSGGADNFLKVAADEARHFTYLVDRLEALGCKYGDLAIHGGLWDSAKVTSASLIDRLAIVHMVHEARGLDVNPATIAKFERAKDMESTEKLKTIHDPPFNETDRAKAGLDTNYYKPLSAPPVPKKGTLAEEK
ncbi:hypothetical protein HDU67_007353 [Dinochytrium kinnereticum]|nr:hypothetical protein HDU67_007353 [Dinochytrium kinnereticum]